MKTKLLTLLLALVAGAGTMFASDTSVGGIWYNFDSSSKTASVTYRGSSYSSSSNEYTGDVVIPASVTYNDEEYSVTSIGNDAFYGCTGLTSVTIPNSVTSIGSFAFSGCTDLTSVHISDMAAWCAISFENYSANPLYYAHNLYLNDELITNLVIPDNITSIGEYTFYQCTGLTSVTIPGSVTSIGNYAFNQCAGLTSVTIPNSVTSIGNDAFSYCRGLTSVTIPNSVTSIGISAFNGCSVLTSVTIESETPPTLGSSAFANTNNCPIYVPCGTLETYQSTWTSYSSQIEYEPLKYIVTGKVNIVDAGSVQLPPTNCREITAIPNYGYHFTQWSDGDTNNPRTIEVTQDTTFQAIFAKNVYSITKNAEHGSIEGNASAEYLDEVTLTVSFDYGYHFTQWSDGNTENPRIFVLTQDTTFTAEFAIDRTGSCGDDNMLTWEYEPESKTLTISGEGTLNSNYTFGLEAPTNIQTLVIQNGVTSVGNSAFANEDKMTSLTLPDGLTAIGDNAFINCKKLTEVTIPASVIEIGESAFRNGNRLATVVLGSGVETIGNNAFANCPYILYVYARMEYPPIIDASVFADCGELSYVDLYVPEDSYARYRKIAVWNSFNIKTIVPTGMEKVQGDEVPCTKFLRNGQILILRNGNTYTIDGKKIEN